MVASLAWCIRSAMSVAAFCAGVLLARMGRVPKGGNDSRPSNMTVVKNRRLVDGKGRRKSDSSLALAKPYGSSTPISANSAPAGIPIPTRINPLFSNMLYAARRAPTVDTSASGEFDPSLVRKIGSRPCVFLNRSWTSPGEIDQAVEGTWQLTHERPFVPRLRKNGLSGLTTSLPSRETVRSTPFLLGVSRRAARLDDWLVNFLPRPCTGSTTNSDKTRNAVASAQTSAGVLMGWSPVCGRYRFVAVPSGGL